MVRSNRGDGLTASGGPRILIFRTSWLRVRFLWYFLGYGHSVDQKSDFKQRHGQARREELLELATALALKIDGSLPGCHCRTFGS
jgi:hypothetical protein